MDLMNIGYVQANTNGCLHDARTPSLSALNRGFLYGDAIYEVWRTYKRVIYAWEEHWKRLTRSAASLGMDIPWRPTDLRQEIRATVEAFEAMVGVGGEFYIRLQIYRGEGSVGLDTQLASGMGFIILVKPVPTLSAEQLEEGLKLTVAQSIRRNPIDALNPAWKTGNYLNNIMGLREAKARGADEVLFLNLAGELTESSTSNVAFIRGNQFVTPPTSAGILHGITREGILSGIGALAGLEVHEENIRPETLAEFDEAMLLSSTKDVQPVGEIDGVSFRTGADTVTRHLKSQFQTHAIDYAASHPELTV